jgi:hypothetical protein
VEERSLKDFLENVPPGKEVLVSDFLTKRNDSIYIARPQLQLHCTSEECQGIRFFGATDEASLSSDTYNNKYLTYVCRNCNKTTKTFSLGAFFQEELTKWNVFKYGEEPSFGPPTPARAIKLIGGEKQLFLLGRRCENQGMGIGAFVYYRRVIESQKNRIFDELIRVIGKISPGDAVLKEIEAAKNETQFTKAVETVKHALPQSLHINGYNPLTLLHSALSEGVHEHNDSECLELASSVRTVLFEFADRLGQALKEEAELNTAVSKLANRKNRS